MTLLDHQSVQHLCDCDAPLRATAQSPSPFHRTGCAALFCPDCGQDTISHAVGDVGQLCCPDGLGSE